MQVHVLMQAWYDHSDMREDRPIAVYDTYKEAFKVAEKNDSPFSFELPYKAAYYVLTFTVNKAPTREDLAIL